jgi:membrane protein
MQYLEERAPETRRSWWKRRVWALVWVTASILVFGIGSALVFSFIGGPIRLLESLVSQESAAHTSYVLALGLLYGLALLMLAGFYRVVLHARGKRRGVFVGAALAISISGVTSFLFAVYVARLASYALYYGSLAAVAITMVWLWLLCLFVLAGAEFLVSYGEQSRT